MTAWFMYDLEVLNISNGSNLILDSGMCMRYVQGICGR